MARYRTTVHSSSAVESTFAYLSRFDHAAEWDPGVGSATMLTDEPVRAGSRFGLVIRLLGTSAPMEYEIVEFDPPGRVVLRSETGRLRSIDTITVTAVGPGALVDYDARLEARGVLRVADPLLAVLFRRIAARSGSGLRDRLASVPLP